MFSSLFRVLRGLFCAKLSIMQRQSTIRLAGKVPKVRTGRRERQARGANFGKNFIALCHDSGRNTPRGPPSDFRAPSALPLFADNLPEVRTKGSGRTGSSRRRSELSEGKCSQSPHRDRDFLLRGMPWERVRSEKDGVLNDCCPPKECSPSAEMTDAPCRDAPRRVRVRSKVTAEKNA